MKPSFYAIFTTNIKNIDFIGGNKMSAPFIAFHRQTNKETGIHAVEIINGVLMCCTNLLPEVFEPVGDYYGIVSRESYLRELIEC